MDEPTMAIIVFDTETSSLSPGRGCRVVEIGAVRVAGPESVDEFHTLIDAGVPIDPCAQIVHGISRTMLKGRLRRYSCKNLRR